MERTNESIKLLFIKIEEELPKLYLKSVVILLEFFLVFEEYFKVSQKDLDKNLIYCVSLLGFTWQCGMNYTDPK